MDSAAPDTSAAAVVSPASAGAAGPVAALNSVQQVQREYSFNPERYSDAYNDSGSYWAVSASIPIQIQRLWGKMEEAKVESASTARQPLGHYIFDNESESWRRNATPGHAAKKVWIELDRASYLSQGRTREMRSSIFALAFPDTGAQVTLINPSMVQAMGGASLVTNASLLIKDAGGI